LSRGRVEARITVPTGGWAISLTITTIGTFTVTVPAGTYFPTALLSTFKTLLDAATGGDGTFTVTGSFGESGTGFVTISHTVQTFTITWTSTELRDVLGFAGTLTPAALSFTGTINAGGVWLPSCDHDAPRGRDNGVYQIDRAVTTAPGGTTIATGYQRRRKLGRVSWPLSSRARTLESGETVTGESFERWWLDTHGGRVSYFGMSPQVQLYWNADDTVKVTLKLTEPLTEFNPRRVDNQWIGIWEFGIDGFQVPGT
jgi:hypothetical protein